MKKKLLTIEDLVQFCQTQNFHKFNATETGYQLSVQVPAIATFKKEESEDTSLLFCKVQLYHIGRNRNGSAVTKEAAEKSLSTIAYKPLLANFCEIDGVRDFTSHDMIFNKDGSIEYIERQIGAFTADKPFIEYCEEHDKEFVYAYVAIPREYTDAAEIIERKNGTKVSVELIINAMSYDASEKVLNLEDVVVQGATCLGVNPETGEEVGEGMKGARLDIVDFSVENNSMQFNNNDELLLEIKKLNETLSHFTINSKLEEGGSESVNKFEELLEKYGKTVEDITFEYENLSDEELEAKFAEVFEEDDTDGEGTDPEPASEGDEGNEPEPEADDANADEGNDNQPENDGSDGADEGAEGEQFAEKLVRTYEVSHDDIRNALYNLLVPYEESDNTYYWIMEVFDNHFVYQSMTGTVYGQKYAVEGDNVSFDGERYELFLEYLTESEKTALNEMRSNYSVIEKQLKEYQSKEEAAQKDALFASEDYSSIADKKEFKELEEDHAEFSIDELKNKLDAIILDYAKKGNLNFSVEPEKNGVGKVTLPINTKTNKKSRYGSLFSK